jgi:hypothetical protein
MEATRPLQRQIRSLQNDAQARALAWANAEANLTSRLQTAEKALAEERSLGQQAAKETAKLKEDIGVLQSQLVQDAFRAKQMKVQYNMPYSTCYRCSCCGVQNFPWSTCGVVHLGFSSTRSMP